jgi:hypothetical protein
VYGTVGFIVAMWAISLAGVELSNVQLYIAAASSLLLAIYSLTLPAIPVAKSEAAPSLASKLGLNAFVLFKNPRMAVFFLFAMLLGAVLQITNTFGSPFLHDFAKNPEFSDSFIVKYPSLLLSVSQMSEVLFILTIPFFLRRYGIKTVMLMSMVAWMLRFGLFAFGDPSAFGFTLLLMSNDKAALLIAISAHHRFQALTFAFALNTLGNPHVRSPWHKDQITRRQGDVGGQARAFGAKRIFHHLHHQILALTHQLGDVTHSELLLLFARHAFGVRHDVRSMKKCSLIQTNIYKCRLHTRKHTFLLKRLYILRTDSLETMSRLISNQPQG